MRTSSGTMGNHSSGVAIAKMMIKCWGRVAFKYLNLGSFKSKARQKGYLLAYRRFNTFTYS